MKATNLFGKVFQKGSTMEKNNKEPSLILIETVVLLMGEF